jgi:hypothetical protein
LTLTYKTLDNDDIVQGILKLNNFWSSRKRSKWFKSK